MNRDLLSADVKSELLDRINKLTASTAPLWGRMNVSQMMAHCQEQMGVAIGERTVKSNLISKLFGGLIKKVVLKDKPFDKNLPTAPSFVIRHDPNFQEEKEKLIAMISRFTKENISTQPHPIFGKMTHDEWSKGTWKHLDHHLRQFGV